MKKKIFKPIFYKGGAPADNAETASDAQKKKKKKRRIRLTAVIIIFFAVVTTDIYFEAIGLPDFLKTPLIKELRQRIFF
jgi:hypothetical protein